MNRRCSSCSKTTRNRKTHEEECLALDEMLGKFSDCFAWDNKIEWVAATMAYTSAHENITKKNKRKGR
jgi:hypothetical protein